MKYFIFVITISTSINAEIASHTIEIQREEQPIPEHEKPEPHENPRTKPDQRVPPKDTPQENGTHKTPEQKPDTPTTGPDTTGPTVPAVTQPVIEPTTESQGILRATIDTFSRFIYQFKKFAKSLLGIKPSIDDLSREYAESAKNIRESQDALKTAAAKDQTADMKKIIALQVSALDPVIDVARALLMQKLQALTPESTLSPQELQALVKEAQYVLDLTNQEIGLQQRPEGQSLYQFFETGSALQNMTDKINEAEIKRDGKKANQLAYAALGLPDFATSAEVQKKWDEYETSTDRSARYYAAREAKSLLADPVGKTFYDAYLVASNDPSYQTTFNRFAAPQELIGKRFESAMPLITVVSLLGQYAGEANFSGISAEDLTTIKAMVSSTK